MSTLGKLYRAETTIDFVGQRKRWFRVSLTLLAIALLSLIFRNGVGEIGLNLSLDFVGGVSVSVENVNGVEESDVASALEAAGVVGARIETLDDGDMFRVKTEFLSDARQTEMVRALAQVTGVSIEETSVDAVGPTFGAQIAERALLALVVFLGVVMLFISIRFEWKMALGAIAALFHDLLLTAGVYSITNLEVTPSTVVALLTILGYSLYDTVVVYDKIEEVTADADGKKNYSEIVNLSMNQVLMRSLNTSLTSLLPVGSLLVLGSLFFGASSIHDFALALFVGIAAGTYSSIFIASPILGVWKEKEPEWIDLRARLEGRLEAAQARGAKGSDGGSATPTSKQSLAGGSFDSRPGSNAGSKPRPPKKRKG